MAFAVAQRRNVVDMLLSSSSSSHDTYLVPRRRELEMATEHVPSSGRKTLVEKLKVRPSSPPPLITDEPETVDDDPVEEKAPSQPMLYSGYQRKKSQSVKLTRLDQLGPPEKKAVRFADDFGLELSQIKLIKSDDMPSPPSPPMKTITYIEADFENPIYSQGFDDRLAQNKIILEQASKSLTSARSQADLDV